MRFEQFIESGDVRRQHPDFSRAESLRAETAKRRFFLKEVIEKLGLKETNTNYLIEIAYDLLMEAVRARMLEEGFETRSHEAEVAFLRRLDFSEVELRLADELRRHRNKILYYGKTFEKDYARKALGFVESAYTRIQQNTQP